MKFGYLIIVSVSEEFDYPKMAYALALSIKNTQKEGYDSVALVINDKSKLDKLKSLWVFDHIIETELPPHWDGRSFMDQLTPFEATVCLDADMLFFEDHSHWVEYFLENSDLYIANRAYTYRGEMITDDYYRRTFTANELPNLYSFYSFFKKDSKTVSEFFTLVRYITTYPTEFSNLFLSKFKPSVLGTDEVLALAAKILGIENDISYELDFPKIVHAKPMVQNWPWPADRLTDHAGFNFNKSGKLKLGNYQQNNIVHYVEKDKITDEVISILEDIAWKN
jgi:hypothetical protein